MSNQQKFRLLTRSDFDGLVCAILLKELGILGEVKFVHPKDVQDGIVDVTDEDILTNLPYDQKCHLCFDHHDSERIRSEGRADNHFLTTDASSAARVVYDYYGGANRFPGVDPVMLDEVDKADAANFTRDEIVDPQGWVLLSMIMDPRTGLGRFHHFRVSNHQLMMDLIDYCVDHSIDEILSLPDVHERVETYRSQSALAHEQIRRCSTVSEKLVILDLRDEETIFATNRFTIYSLFPQCDISMHVLWGKQRQNTVFAIGKSILDRGCQTHVGKLCLSLGGGGHEAAGTCQVKNEEASDVLAELVAKINAEAQATAAV